MENEIFQGLLLEALVENVPCRVTIDTGSSITIVNSTLLPSLNIPIENIKPVRNSIRTVTGDKVPLVGRGQMTITVSNTKFIYVWIGDVTEDVILGLDFMTLHRCQLDLEHSSICVGGEYVSLLYNGKRDAKCYRVVVSTAVIIPPRTEVIVKGSVRGTKSVKGYCTIEPCKHNVPDVLVGKVLANLDNCCVPVRVLNIADKPRKIKRGVCLARCETVSGDDVFGEGTDEELRMNENELPTSEDGLPNHLHSPYNRSVCSLQNEEEQVLLKNFLCEYSDVFSKSASDIGQTNVVKHSIFTGDHPPIKQQARRMPRVKGEEAGRAVDDMLKDGIIEQSTSPWSSPIVLVRKKNGTTRFCVDYRKLNNITRKDSYPLPRIDDTMEALQGATWFSTLDLKSGYWQVQLSPEAIEKTAFSVAGHGHWQFKVMPFGLCNAPATFDRLMEHVLAGLSWKICLVYLDDVIRPVYTANYFDTALVI